MNICVFSNPVSFSDPSGLDSSGLDTALNWFRSNYPEVTEGLESRIWGVENLNDYVDATGVNVCLGPWCPIILVDTHQAVDDIVDSVAHECKHNRQSYKERKEMERQDAAAQEAAKHDPTQVPWGPIVDSRPRCSLEPLLATVILLVALWSRLTHVRLTGVCHKLSVARHHLARMGGPTEELSSPYAGCLSAARGNLMLFYILLAVGAVLMIHWAYRHSRASRIRRFAIVSFALASVLVMYLFEVVF